jgi:hypothetical protein
MLNLLKGGWTPVTILVLWIVVGILRCLNLIGATVGNAVILQLLAIGFSFQCGRPWPGVAELFPLGDLNIRLGTQEVLDVL